MIRGPRHVAAPIRVAQGEDGLVGGAQVRDGGEAGHQGLAGIAGPDHRLVGVGPGHAVQPAVGALLAGQVDVAVDQAGQDEFVAQIDHIAFANEAVADIHDFVPCDHESFIALHDTGRGIGQKSPHLHERRSRFGGNGGRRGGLRGDASAKRQTH
jgi:hypothetical protein